MAKPFEVELSSSPGPSRANFFPPHLSRKASEPILHRSHRPSTHLLSKASPSTTLLSLLASLASASSVYGSPAPPPFLCPTLESGEIADCAVVKRTPTQIHRASPRAVDIENQIIPRSVPDRYSQGPDGTFRRVGSYTLYGSTMPACSSSSCATPTPVSPLDNQIQVSDSTDSTNTTQTPDDKPTDLPPGWKPLARHNRTAVILVISLILALFIGSFIIGCMFCRNRMKKTRHKFRDVEAKAKKRRRMSNDADAREIAVEKEMKTKQKIWARATARWRANARLAARQRRGRRTGPRLSHSNHSSASLEDSRNCFAETSTLPHSGASPRSSTASLAGEIHRSDTVSSSLSLHEEMPTPVVPPVSPARTSPPAYHHYQRQVPSLVISTGKESRIEFAGSSAAAGWERLPQISDSSPYTLLSDLSSSCPTSSSLHVAHVATDDKALLSRLAEFASAPPDDASEEILQTSAPEWHDEDLEDIAPHLLAATSEPFPFSSVFPAPPSKERLAAAEFYDHLYAFEEVGPAELAIGPSAPPFEEGPSPPQQEGLGLVPSAPPLFDDDQASEAQPSAPFWERSSQDEQESELDNTSGQGQEPSDDTDISSGGQRHFSGTSASPIRDSILLPGYQP